MDSENSKKPCIWLVVLALLFVQGPQLVAAYISIGDKLYQWYHDESPHTELIRPISR